MNPILGITSFWGNILESLLIFFKLLYFYIYIYIFLRLLVICERTYYVTGSACTTFLWNWPIVKVRNGVALYFIPLVVGLAGTAPCCCFHSIVVIHVVSAWAAYAVGIDQWPQIMISGWTCKIKCAHLEPAGSIYAGYYKSIKASSKQFWPTYRRDQNRS